MEQIARMRTFQVNRRDIKKYCYEHRREQGKEEQKQVSIRVEHKSIKQSKDELFRIIRSGNSDSNVDNDNTEFQTVEEYCKYDIANE